MLVKLLHLLDPRKAIGLFAIAVCILTGGLYFIFDTYLDSVGKEIAGSWLQSEAVAIQEGNLLTSISKNQRVLLSSQFVKGVKLIDSSALGRGALIEFGEPFQPYLHKDLKDGKVLSFTDGFLSRQVLYRVPERPDLILSFKTYSDFLTRSFIAAVAAFLFFLLFLFINIRRLESRRIAAENKNRIILGEIAARVAHDIRSPLNTLNSVLDTIDDISPESKRLLTTAIQRIREISSGISDQSRLALKESANRIEASEPTPTMTEATLVYTLIESLIEEKQVQYKERAGQVRLQLPSDQSFSSFCAVNSLELKRSLSNLIDNAVEASAPDAPIKVGIFSDGSQVVIEVLDRGSGIPKDVLSKIGERGFSFGKPKGTGLGVHYAKKLIVGWGGTFSISSEMGLGTSVRVTLPVVKAPSWYTDAISLGDSETVIVVDDDPTIHALWQERLKTVRPEVTIEHFFEPESVMSWIVQNRHVLDKSILLTDYNLNSRAGDGISVLERFGGTHPFSVMVTSAFDDAKLQEQCEKLNVKILPKSVMNFVPIQVAQ
jgi:signal transduction histidine kinase